MILQQHFSASASHERREKKWEEMEERERGERDREGGEREETGRGREREREGYAKEEEERRLVVELDKHDWGLVVNDGHGTGVRLWRTLAQIDDPRAILHFHP